MGGGRVNQPKPARSPIAPRHPPPVQALWARRPFSITLSYFPGLARKEHLENKQKSDTRGFIMCCWNKTALKRLSIALSRARLDSKPTAANAAGEWMAAGNPVTHPGIWHPRHWLLLLPALLRNRLTNLSNTTLLPPALHWTTISPRITAG